MRVVVAAARVVAEGTRMVVAASAVAVVAAAAAAAVVSRARWAVADWRATRRSGEDALLKRPREATDDVACVAAVVEERLLYSAYTRRVQCVVVRTQARLVRKPPSAHTTTRRNRRH
jgi:hypothetical protein